MSSLDETPGSSDGVDQFRGGPPGLAAEDAYHIDDALWVVRPIDYVPTGPALETTLFDNPTHLSAVWHATVNSLRADANEDEDIRERIANKAREIIASIDAEAKDRAIAAEPEAERLMVVRPIRWALANMAARWRSRRTIRHV